ncbi:MAG: SMC-Scp complex subunit ScpB, partial [Gammaproteobacteria bacterium]|nr:SMC-Scp complex subunit ScpB [Gammaproteobacteria bacterium]
MSQTVNLDTLEHIIEAAIMAHESPMSLVQLANLFEEDQRPDTKTLKIAIENLQNACADRGVELKQVASGYRYQAKQEFAPWLRKLWEERPARYSRALMETLALIIYRQPITRAEIEEIRGVSVSSNLVKTLMERGWVKEVGVREVLGRPALLATTQEFLDYFNIKSLSELPTLQELTDLDIAGTELEKQMILLEQEQQQAEADHDKAAADAIDME